MLIISRTSGANRTASKSKLLKTSLRQFQGLYRKMKKKQRCLSITQIICFPIVLHTNRIIVRGPKMFIIIIVIIFVRSEKNAFTSGLNSRWEFEFQFVLRCLEAFDCSPIWFLQDNHHRLLSAFFSHFSHHFDKAFVGKHREC